MSHLFPSCHPCSTTLMHTTPSPALLSVTPACFAASLRLL